ARCVQPPHLLILCRVAKDAGDRGGNLAASNQILRPSGFFDPRYLSAKSFDARDRGPVHQGPGVVRTPSASFPAIGTAKPHEAGFALLAIHCAHDVARSAAGFAATSRRRDVAL